MLGEPGVWFSLAFLLFFVISLVDSYVFGIDVTLFNYVFFYLSIATVYNLGIGLEGWRWRRLMQRAGLLFLFILYLHIAVNYRAMLDFLADPWGGHPSISSFFGGGVNLDASWLALFGVFFERDAKGNVFLLGSLGVSAMYASRAGMILALLALFYVHVVTPRNWGMLKRVAAVAVVAAVVLLAAQFGGIIVDRFLSIGSDQGSQGRKDMWQWVVPAFCEAPLLGAGAGNAISHLEPGEWHGLS